MNEDPPICRHLLIHGRVQGVSYRASAAHQARLLHLAGWVRNRHDGSVEALVAGPAHQVEAFITWARRGPDAARVDDVRVQPAQPPAEGPFQVWPMA